jgi:hypothetical protein
MHCDVCAPLASTSRVEGARFHVVNRPGAPAAEQRNRALAKRGRVKAMPRARDEESLASGEKTPQELRRENANFAWLNVRLDVSGIRSLI